MLNPFELKCPKCQSDDIELDDIYDEENYGDGIIQKCVGTCQHCKAELQWDRIYDFVGYDNIEAIDEEGAE